MNMSLQNMVKARQHSRGVKSLLSVIRLLGFKVILDTDKISTVQFPHLCYKWM